MRLFIAVELTEELKKSLVAYMHELKKAGVKGQYAAMDNLHMTLAFIREWPDDVTGLLPAVGKPFSITLSHTGIFPEANVLWAGVKPSEELDSLAGQVRRRLEDAGVPFDRKSFYPHITLARKPAVPENLRLPEIRVPDVSMIVDEVCLYRSDPGKNGMAYTVIGSSAGNSR